MVKKVNFKEVFVVLIFVGEIKFHVFKLMVIQPTHIKRTDEWKSIFIELIQYFCTTVYSSNGYGDLYKGSVIKYTGTPIHNMSNQV